MDAVARKTAVLSRRNEVPSAGRWIRPGPNACFVLKRRIFPEKTELLISEEEFFRPERSFRFQEPVRAGQNGRFHFARRIRPG